MCDQGNYWIKSLKIYFVVWIIQSYIKPNISTILMTRMGGSPLVNTRNSGEGISSRGEQDEDWALDFHFMNPHIKPLL